MNDWEALSIFGSSLFIVAVSQYFIPAWQAYAVALAYILVITLITFNWRKETCSQENSCNLD